MQLSGSARGLGISGEQGEGSVESNSKPDDASGTNNSMPPWRWKSVWIELQTKRGDLRPSGEARKKSYQFMYRLRGAPSSEFSNKQI